MALATRCPKCKALFRVVADQLKLRGGLVRCGSCRHVFDAIGSLTYVDDITVQKQPAAATPAVAAAPAPAQSPPAADRPARSEKRLEPSRRIDLAGSEAGVPTLILTDPPTPIQGTRQSETPVSAAAAAERPPVVIARDEDAVRTRREGRRQRKLDDERAHAGAAQNPDEVRGDEPAAAEFLQGRQQSRSVSVVFGGGSLLLFALMLLQLAVVFRVELSTQFPTLRPTLVQLCKPINCDVGWPTRAESLALVGTELQAVPGTDVLELTAVIRNRASFTVALPAIEVTLTDTNSRDVARKVFAPVDYFASSGQSSNRIDEGLAAGADYEVRIHFEARGLSAAGYRVYPFYL
ncbi:MAG: DUF3426 domain-containing protein [Burkholderiales bacterium]|jgi:predicted Zn finger-like uncharacterized protein|nr:DUF3426 domain-containing protein [Burkholderiales bacterium]